MGNASNTVIENADAYIRIIAILYVICFIVSSFIGFYRGLGMIHVPLIGTVLQISIRVVLSYLLIDRLGLSAVAFATGMGWVAFGVFEGILYKTKIEKQFQNETYNTCYECKSN